MARYRLTIRHGPQVQREAYDALEEAVAAMARHADEVLAEGALDTVKMLREFEPSQRVAARLEISAGGWLRGRDAGVDVMGDGSLVPYRGTVLKQRLEPRPGQSAFDAVREAIGG